MAEHDPKKSAVAGPIVFSVSQVNEYISRRMFSDPFLASIRVVGEVTNLSCSSSGHAFFALKDENALLSCVLYDFAEHDSAEAIVEGARLEIGGRITFYRKNAAVQLIVETVQAGGLGDLFARFERTKRKLLKEGLFDASRKKALPAFPLRLGVVTSPSGAVLHDIINVATRRFDGVHILVYPVPVQGTEAPSRVCRGIAYFNEKNNVDVIIVARGGGSFEDLAAFNEESVARAVGASAIPVVSAVGHETDYSLCDMAADLRAPTPSAAAELVVREKGELTDALTRRKDELTDALVRVLADKTALLERLSAQLRAFAPRVTLARAQQALDMQRTLLDTAVRNVIAQADMRLEKYRDRLESLSPRRVLNRGYAIVHGGQGVVVSAAQAQDSMEIEFSDGRVAVRRG